MRILQLKIDGLLATTLIFILSLATIFIFSINHTQEVTTNSYPHIFLANNLIKEADRMSSAMRELTYATHDILPTNSAKKTKEIQEIIKSNQKTDVLIEELNLKKYSENENDIVNKIKDSRIKYDIVTHDFLQQLKMGNRTDTNSIFTQIIEPLQSQYRTSLQDFLNYHLELLQTNYQTIQQHHIDMQNNIFYFSEILFLLISCIFLLVIHNIKKSLRTSLNAAESLAAGNLSSQLLHANITGKNQASQLLRTIKTINDNLICITNQIDNSSHKISTESSKFDLSWMKILHLFLEQNKTAQRAEEQSLAIPATTIAETLEATTNVPPTSAKNVQKKRWNRSMRRRKKPIYPEGS